MNKNSILSIVVVIFIIIGSIIGINVYKSNLKNKLTFTQEDYNYMYNDIETMYGNGEEFHVAEITEKYIDETITSVAGKKVSIIGYFDSQKNMYIVVYAKYLEDKPIYKNGDAGNILCIAVNANYSKEEYFNSNEAR